MVEVEVVVVTEIEGTREIAGKAGESSSWVTKFKAPSALCTGRVTFTLDRASVNQALAGAEGGQHTPNWSSVIIKIGLHPRAAPASIACDNLETQSIVHPYSRALSCRVLSVDASANKTPAARWIGYNVSLSFRSC